MLSISEAKKLIGQDGKQLSDGEILKLLSDLYILADLVLKSWQSNKSCEENKSENGVDKLSNL